MAKFQDLTGMRFGRLRVIKRDVNKGNYAMWRCVCDCGNQIVVRTSSLKNGHTQSCGCYHKDIASGSNTKHGLYKHRLYRIYQHMISRCTNCKENGYKNYGGRGIKVCDEWLKDFQSFAKWSMLNGYSDGLTLDRIDVNSDYSPLNCRWCTPKVQANNTRKNRILEYRGERHTMSEWSDILQMPYNLINSRIFRGWSVEKALTTPLNKSYQRQKH